MSNDKCQIKQWGKALVFTLLLINSNLLSAQMTDRDLFDAYQREDMTVWKAYIDRLRLTEDRPATPDRVQTVLQIAYGFCGYLVGESKESRVERQEALRYVQYFKSQITNHKSQMPAGHYEMYRSAVYVYELRLHESFHPIKAMSLAKEATRLAPDDPVVLSYYGTCLFYAPKPFGSKAEALQWFEKAEPLFQDPQYQFSWLREANTMYISQCKEKIRKVAK